MHRYALPILLACAAASLAAAAGNPQTITKLVRSENPGIEVRQLGWYPE